MPVVILRMLSSMVQFRATKHEHFWVEAGLSVEVYPILSPSECARGKRVPYGAVGAGLGLVPAFTIA
eukprot:3443853-Pyramimonas_sp.AAC.1